MSLRVGIIGAGQAGERQAIGFAEAAGSEVIAIADIERARAVALAQRFDAAVYTDWRAMLKDGLDIVAVCLPHNMHVAPAELAADLGIHVMMEKPIATTIEDGQRIIDACHLRGVKLTISFVHRFREEMQLLHKRLRSGELGQPIMARETMHGQRGSHLPAWVEQRDVAGGGVLMYSTIHGIDRLRWLLASEVTRVTAQTRTFEPDAEVEHGAVALLTFANSAVASLMTSAPSYPAKPALWETEIFGASGMARARNRHWVEWSNAAGQERQNTRWCAEQLGEHYNFVRQAEAFITAIGDDAPPVVTADDGIRALAIVQAIYQSAASENTITLKP